MALWLAAAGVGAQLGGAYFGQRGAARRGRRAQRAAGAAMERYLGEYQAALAPHRRRYGEFIGLTEAEARKPYQEAAKEFFAPIRAETEEARARALPSLRAGQAGRGFYTAGPGAAQEAELQRRVELGLAGQYGAISQAQQARIDALRRRLYEEAAPYERAGVELPLTRLGYETGLIAQRYGQPRGGEAMWGAMGDVGSQAVQLAMLQYLMGGGGGGAPAEAQAAAPPRGRPYPVGERYYAPGGFYDPRWAEPRTFGSY